MLARTSVDAVGSSGLASQLSSMVRRLGQQILTYAITCADYYTAATQYERLNALSDAELRRRGLSRDRLARDVCLSLDRSQQTVLRPFK